MTVMALVDGAALSAHRRDRVRQLDVLCDVCGKERDDAGGTSCGDGAVVTECR